LPLEWHVLSCFFGRTWSSRKAILNLSDMQNLCRTLSEKPTALGFWERKISKKLWVKLGVDMLSSAFYHHFNGSFWIEETSGKKETWDIDKNIQKPSNVLSFLEIFVWVPQKPWNFVKNPSNSPDLLGSSKRIHRNVRRSEPSHGRHVVLQLGRELCRVC
jgi:hypothetical protein